MCNAASLILLWSSYSTVLCACASADVHVCPTFCVCGGGDGWVRVCICWCVYVFLVGVSSWCVGGDGWVRACVRASNGVCMSAW